MFLAQECKQTQEKSFHTSFSGGYTVCVPCSLDNVISYFMEGYTNLT